MKREKHRQQRHRKRSVSGGKDPFPREEKEEEENAASSVRFFYVLCKAVCVGRQFSKLKLAGFAPSSKERTLPAAIPHQKTHQYLVG